MANKKNDSQNDSYLYNSMDRVRCLAWNQESEEKKKKDKEEERKKKKSGGSNSMQGKITP